METLNNIVLTIQDYMSNIVLIIALLGAGIWFSFRLKFIQIRGFKRGIKQVFGGLFGKKGEAGNDGMSSFQALATAIAAQVGTGNIAERRQRSRSAAREPFSGCGWLHFWECLRSMPRH